MQIFDGTLRVETKHGKRGAFNVGVLHTRIGDFHVKDKCLDQFEAASINWNGRSWSELRAVIADDGFAIDTGDETPVPADTSEPDPIDTEVDAVALAKPASGRAAPATDKPVSKPSAVADSSDDAKIFGVELYALFAAKSPTIALDSSADREQFRLQRTRLKECGYRFDSTTQTWGLAVPA
jgi:hypothetical protein